MKRNRVLFVTLIIGLCFLFAGCGTSILPDGAVEYHHIFPRQFREEFARQGINVDDFTIALTKKDHRGIGKGLQYVPTNWNDEWNQWLQTNPHFTQKDAAAKAKDMLNEAGCKGEFHFYDYNTKKLSNATVGGASAMFICSNSWFLNVCGKLGYWLLKVLGGSNIGGQILALLAVIGSTVLGLFGIKAEHPVTIGVGLVCIILGILGIVGIVFFVKWLIGLVVLGGGGAGVIAANS